MKKILSISTIMFAAFLGLTSCVGEEELLFDKSAAERLNEASDLYTKHLLSSPNGWAFEYYPKSSVNEEEPLLGVGYLMLAKFNPDMSVDVGMTNRFTNETYSQDRSAWAVLTDNGPVLSFNSYNKCIHTFSDPEDIRFTPDDDEQGKGMQGDYEFVMVDVPADADYVLLKGKKRGTYSRLTKLDEATDFAEYISDVKAFQSNILPTSSPNYNVIKLGEKVYNIIMAPNGGDIGLTKIWPEGSDSILTKDLNPMLVTRRGTADKGYSYHVRFNHSIKGDNDDVKEQEFVYNEEEKKFHAVNDANNTIEGPNPTVFFPHALLDSHKWSVTTKSVSDDFNNALDNVIKTASSLNYTFKSMTFTGLKDQELTLDLVFSTTRKVNGKPQTVTATARYLFDAKYDENGVTIAYKEPANDDSKNVYNVITSLADFFSTLSTTFVVKDGGNPFVLDNCRVEKKDNSNFWFDVTYVR